MTTEDRIKELYKLINDPFYGYQYSKKEKEEITKAYNNLLKPHEQVHKVEETKKSLEEEIKEKEIADKETETLILENNKEFADDISKDSGEKDEAFIEDFKTPVNENLKEQVKEVKKATTKKSTTRKKVEEEILKKVEDSIDNIENKE